MSFFSRREEPFNKYDISTWTYKNRDKFVKEFSIGEISNGDYSKCIKELEGIKSNYLQFPEIVETITIIERSIVYLMKNDGIQFFSAIKSLNEQIQREVGEKRKKAMGQN